MPPAWPFRAYESGRKRRSDGREDLFRLCLWKSSTCRRYAKRVDYVGLKPDRKRHKYRYHRHHRHHQHDEVGRDFILESHLPLSSKLWGRGDIPESRPLCGAARHISWRRDYNRRPDLTPLLFSRAHSFAWVSCQIIQAKYSTVNNRQQDRIEKQRPCQPTPTLTPSFHACSDSEQTWGRKLCILPKYHN